MTEAPPLPAADTDGDSVPQPSENARISVSPQRFPRKARRETQVLPSDRGILRFAQDDRGPAAAGGRKRQGLCSAAFGKRKEMRKPAAFSAKGKASYRRLSCQDRGILRSAQDDRYRGSKWRKSPMGSKTPRGAAFCCFIPPAAGGCARSARYRLRARSRRAGRRPAP